MSPDVVVGDFDSLTGERPTQGEHTIALPPEKDDPDLLSALKIGWSHHARLFHIYGALGGRIDHTISNIQLMALLAQHGAVGFLHGNGSIVTAICDGALDFGENNVEPGRMVSVFSHSDTSLGVSERGLKYEIDDMTMTSTHVNGVSNEFLNGAAAHIGVEHGTLVVTFPRRPHYQQSLGTTHSRVTSDRWTPKYLQRLQARTPIPLIAKRRKSPFVYHVYLEKMM